MKAISKLLTVIAMTICIGLAIFFIGVSLASCHTTKHLDSQTHILDSSHQVKTMEKAGTVLDSAVKVIHLDTSKITTWWNYERQTRILTSVDTIHLDSGKVILKPKTDTWITEWGNLQKAENKAVNEQTATDLHRSDSSTHRTSTTSQVQIGDKVIHQAKEVKVKTGQILSWILVAAALLGIWFFWPYLSPIILPLFRRKKES